LSKGLGAPVGSVLCGTAARIATARRWRKVLGGGMRQAGVLAAAGIYALENNVARLAEDHANARLLATLLSRIDEVTVESVQTNMVFARVEPAHGQHLRGFLEQRRIRIHPGPRFRFVTHLDVDRHEIAVFADNVAAFFAAQRNAVSRSA
jgi:threonine aldolase